MDAINIQIDILTKAIVNMGTLFLLRDGITNVDTKYIGNSDKDNILLDISYTIVMLYKELRKNSCATEQVTEIYKKACTELDRQKYPYEP